jgi:adenylosuccinate synthase
MIRAIVGANWGDEGKGKITDICAADSDVVVRFQGGSNAGHTIINEHGKFSLHQLPSGIFHPETLNIIANGVALNIDYLLKEIAYVENAGIKFNLMVSNRAGVLAPYHVLLDELEEERLGDRKFGSTKSGIAPFYSDKYAKVGFQVWELFEEEYLKDKVTGICDKLNIILEHLYKREKLDPEKLYETLRGYGEKIAPYTGDTSEVLNKAIKEGKTILMEGQLGALRDIDHGIYPYVTSSSTLAGYASVGAGIPPYEIKDVIAITKAYSSSVGEGPFVTELFDEEAEELRKRGGDAGEYGATTGRPRRVGFFDAVATRYGCKVQGATELVITCLDVLGYLDEIPVCIGYDIDGEITKDFPVTSNVYKAKPVYTKLPGWKQDIRGIEEYDKLPPQVHDYIKFIEKETNTKIKMVSNGPRRDEIIYINE